MNKYAHLVISLFCNSCLLPSICDLHEAEQNEMKHMKVKEADPIDPHSRHFLSLGPSWTISVRHQKSTTLLFSCQCIMMCLMHMSRQDKFITPRAVLSLALFNGFRVLGHKSADPEELRLFVETMAFKLEA